MYKKKCNSSFFWTNQNKILVYYLFIKLINKIILKKFNSKQKHTFFISFFRLYIYIYIYIYMDLDERSLHLIDTNKKTLLDYDKINDYNDYINCFNNDLTQIFNNNVDNKKINNHNITINENNYDIDIENFLIDNKEFIQLNMDKESYILEKFFNINNLTNIICVNDIENINEYILLLLNIKKILFDLKTTNNSKISMTRGLIRCIHSLKNENQCIIDTKLINDNYILNIKNLLNNSLNNDTIVFSLGFSKKDIKIENEQECDNENYIDKNENFCISDNQKLIIMWIIDNMLSSNSTFLKSLNKNEYDLIINNDDDNYYKILKKRSISLCKNVGTYNSNTKIVMFFKTTYNSLFELLNNIYDIASKKIIKKAPITLKLKNGKNIVKEINISKFSLLSSIDFFLTDEIKKKKEEEEEENFNKNNIIGNNKNEIINNNINNTIINTSNIINNIENYKNKKIFFYIWGTIIDEVNPFENLIKNNNIFQKFGVNYFNVFNSYESLLDTVWRNGIISTTSPFFLNSFFNEDYDNKKILNKNENGLMEIKKQIKYNKILPKLYLSNLNSKKKDNDDKNNDDNDDNKKIENENSFNGYDNIIIKQMSFSKDGKLLYFIMSDGGFRILNIENYNDNNEIKCIIYHYNDVIIFDDDCNNNNNNFNNSYDNDYKNKSIDFFSLSSNEDMVLLSGYKKVSLWNLKTMKKMHTWDLSYLKTVGDEIIKIPISFSCDDLFIVIGSKDDVRNSLSFFEIFDLKLTSQYKLLRKFKGHVNKVNGVKKFPLLSIKSFNDLLNNDDNNNNKKILLSSSSQLFISFSDDYTVRIWDATTSIEYFIFSYHTGPIYDIDISNDYKWLITGSYDKTVALWNLETKKINKIIQHKNELKKVSFTNNNKCCITTTSDNISTIWNLFSEEEEEEKEKSKKNEDYIKNRNNNNNNLLLKSYTAKSIFNCFPSDICLISPDGLYLISSTNFKNFKKKQIMTENLSSSSLLIKDNNDDDIKNDIKNSNAGIYIYNIPSIFLPYFRNKPEIIISLQKKYDENGNYCNLFLDDGKNLFLEKIFKESVKINDNDIMLYNISLLFNKKFKPCFDLKRRNIINFLNQYFSFEKEIIDKNDDINSINNIDNIFSLIIKKTEELYNDILNCEKQISEINLINNLKRSQIKKIIKIGLQRDLSRNLFLKIIDNLMNLRLYFDLVNLINNKEISKDDYKNIENMHQKLVKNKDLFNGNNNNNNNENKTIIINDNLSEKLTVSLWTSKFEIEQEKIKLFYNTIIIGNNKNKINSYGEIQNIINNDKIEYVESISSSSSSIITTKTKTKTEEVAVATTEEISEKTTKKDFLSSHSSCSSETSLIFKFAISEFKKIVLNMHNTYCVSIYNNILKEIGEYLKSYSDFKKNNGYFLKKLKSYISNDDSNNEKNDCGDDSNKYDDDNNNKVYIKYKYILMLFNNNKNLVLSIDNQKNLSLLNEKIKIKWNQKKEIYDLIKKEKTKIKGIEIEKINIEESEELSIIDNSNIEFIDDDNDDNDNCGENNNGNNNNNTIDNDNYGENNIYNKSNYSTLLFLDDLKKSSLLKIEELNNNISIIDEEIDILCKNQNSFFNNEKPWIFPDLSVTIKKQLKYCNNDDDDNNNFITSKKRSTMEDSYDYYNNNNIKNNDKINQENNELKNMEINLFDIKINKNDDDNNGFNDIIKNTKSLIKVNYKGKNALFKKISFDYLDKFSDLSSLNIFQKKIYNLFSLHHENILCYKGITLNKYFKINEIGIIGSGIIFEDYGNTTLFNYIKNHYSVMNNILDDDIIKKRTSCYFNIIKIILSDICFGMSYIHNKLPFPIPHGDLNTLNIYLDENFKSKISNVGISYLFDNEDNINNNNNYELKKNKRRRITTITTTTTTTTKNNNKYIDEDIEEDNINDTEKINLKKNDDIYKFGLIIYEILSGKSYIDSINEGVYSKTLDSIKKNKMLLENEDYLFFIDIMKKCLIKNSSSSSSKNSANSKMKNISFDDLFNIFKEKKPIVYTHEIEKNCEEYKKCENLFFPNPIEKQGNLKSTSYKISRITKIFNAFTDNLYYAEIDNIKNDIKNNYKINYENININEKLLFHGTRSIDPFIIAKNKYGLMKEYSSDGFYGKGLYFAELARYTHQGYVHQTYFKSKRKQTNVSPSLLSSTLSQSSSSLSVTTSTTTSIPLSQTFQSSSSSTSSTLLSSSHSSLLPSSSTLLSSSPSSLVPLSSSTLLSSSHSSSIINSPKPSLQHYVPLSSSSSKNNNNDDINDDTKKNITKKEPSYKILVFSVICGKSYELGNQVNRSLSQKTIPNIYHSIHCGPHLPNQQSGGFNDSDIYVIYKDTQCTPKYIIEYDNI